ncbi:Enterochelin esterase [Ruminococcaceae bacterium YRB3002]|nr:Enterochelin esterase [Ruminococcaceae bacterium YRB3002]
MRKLLSAVLSATLLLSFCSCAVKTREQEKIVLTNRMTDEELASVDKHGLTLLDEPEVEDPVAAFEQAEHKIEFMFTTMTAEDMTKQLEAHRSEMSAEEYDERLKWIEENPDGITFPTGCFFDGYILFDITPLLGMNDGGGVTFQITRTLDDGSAGEPEDISLAGPEEYYEWLRNNYIQDGEPEQTADLAAAKVRMAYEALKSGEYETIPYKEIDYSDPSIWEPNDGQYADYRSEWEYDRDELSDLKDSIDEISIYDQEMDIEFLVHVVLPPDYDPSASYPVFLLTDGVYRLGNCPAMRREMESGEAADMILVTLGYNYHMNGRDEGNRSRDLIEHRGQLLDFITDNLMPYLGENYNIDYRDSSLYGHSDGGIFTHYALFNSDRYENQPFGHYIIGSAAFWCLYDDPEGYDLAGYENDYGYWERNDTLDKSVFICGGSQEDPDYADRYNGHKTTIEGLEALRDDLEAHGVDVTYKLYDSHHWQFIPEMLVEYVRKM